LANGPDAGLLAASRVIGWALGLLVFVGFLLVLRTGHRMIVAERRESAVSATAFIEKVRTCRRLTAGPTPSWNACEQRVRSEL
jgi:hypothetical protein